VQLNFDQSHAHSRRTRTSIFFTNIMIAIAPYLKLSPTQRELKLYIHILTNKNGILAHNLLLLLSRSQLVYNSRISNNE